jgi:predicted transcriptional regulator
MQTKEMEPLYIRAPRLNQLNILSQVLSDSHMTQAELARRCHLSVAMVNNYMKELCSSGLLEYHRKNSKTVSYHLTPAGLKQVEIIERELIRETVGLFAESEAKMLDIILGASRQEIRRVVLFGSGHLMELAFHALESAGVEVIGVCDGAPAHFGREWCGRELLNPSQIRYMKPDAVVIASFENSEEICSRLRYLRDYGISLIRPDGGTQECASSFEHLDDPTVPTYPDESPALEFSAMRRA